MSPRNGDEIVSIIKVIDSFILEINQDMEKCMTHKEYGLLFAQKEILRKLKIAFLKAKE